MRPHRPLSGDDDGPTAPRRSYSLFFFQQEGQRSFLRFTLLGVVVFVLIILIPVMGLLILFFINSRTPFPETNVNISVLPAATAPANTTLIRQAPPPSRPTPRKPPRIPARPTLQPLNNNATEPLIPDQIARPSPSASPP